MNYFGILTYLTNLANKLPNVHTTILSDIYELNSMPAAEFNVFAVVPSSVEDDYDAGVRRYNLVLYMIDRLGEDNRCEIKQTQCLEELSNIIKQSQEDFDVNSKVVYKLFTESFQQLCCGVYASVTFTCSLDDCYEEFE